jgi:membrane-associated phospholipid phosphatase
VTMNRRAPIADQATHRPSRSVVLRSGIVLLTAAVGTIGVMWLCGTLLVDGAVPPLTRIDTSTTEWVVARRTPLLDTLTHVGTMMADTIVALIVAAVAVLALRWWLGHWRESVIVVVAVVGELLIFLAITALVHRDRPPVVRLDEAPPTSSFPSGHTGAAVALYACVAVLLLRTVPHRPLARSLAGVGMAIPVLVAASRVYRGMHYLSDVLAGALASCIWLTVVLIVLLRPAPDGRPPAGGASRRAAP